MNIALKQSFCAILFFIIFSINMTVAQTTYQPDGLVKKIVKGVQIDLASVIIKDNAGKTLDVMTAFPMMQSGKYTMDTYVDEHDLIKEIVLYPKQDGETTTGSLQLSETDLRKELEAIRVKDQAIRRLMGCLNNTSDNEDNASEYNYYLIQLMAQEDKKNQDQVTKIIDENGWLGISIVGETANNALFLVIQHASVEIQEKYFPSLKESAEKGESNLADMALMDDRIRMHRKKKQLYGSQTITLNGKSYVWPIEDAPNIDERRKSVKLPPLAEYLKLFELNYPQDELPDELF